MTIKMKAGKLNTLLKMGFTLEAIAIMQEEIKKMALKEKALINND